VITFLFNPIEMTAVRESTRAGDRRDAASNLSS